MTPNYRLHYAPDNASLVIRLALEELCQPYQTVLVDRSVQEHRSPAFRALNPAGLIPVLETPQGTLFETAAILLWLSERHDALAPHPHDINRAGFVKWLFFASNTLHADLRMLFYPEQYIGADRSARMALRDGVRPRLARHLNALNAAMPIPGPGADKLTVLDLYLVCQLRWMALYPADDDRSWFRLSDYPALHAMCLRMETRDSVRAAITAEGLGPTPFSAPRHPNPPEGSAI